jgi:hypothetical protein
MYLRAGAEARGARVGQGYRVELCGTVDYSPFIKSRLTSRNPL